MPRLAPLAVVLLAAPASAQTFTWTGDGDTPLFSDPANWAAGLVPQSGDANVIRFPDAVGPFSPENDLPGLSVGEVVLDAELAGATGLPVRVTQRVTGQLAGGAQFALSDLPLLLAAGATFDFPATFLPPSQSAGVLAGVTTDGDVAVGPGTGVMLVGSQVAGVVGVPPDASLAAYESFGFVGVDDVGPVTLDLDAGSFQGLFDVDGTVIAGGDGQLDLSDGVLQLQGAPHSIERDYVRRSTVDGDVALGEWRIGGVGPLPYNQSPPAPPVDQLVVTGELDLTDAIIVPGPYAADDGAIFVDFDSPDAPTFVTLIEYGSRVGELAQDTLDVTVFFAGGLAFDGPAPVVYTSGENAGPGEIRLLLPEPGGVAVLASAGAIALTPRRRRR